MVFRLLSGIGAIAHVGDFLLSGVKFADPGPHLVARGARIAGALVVAAILAGCAALSGAAGLEGDVNRRPTVYTVDQLFGVSSAVAPDLHGKTYATITATISQHYVDTYQYDTYKYSDYLIGNPATGNYIVVESKKSEAEMAKQIHGDGTVTLTGMIQADRSEVASAIHTLGTKAADLNVSLVILLKEGETPPNPESMFIQAGLLAAVAALLFVGWAIGYLVFRPGAIASAPFGASVGGPIKVHVTGLIPGVAHGIRTREKKAFIQMPLADGPQLGPNWVDLTWHEGSGWTSLRLAPGISRVDAGMAYPLTGRRPSVRVRFLGYALILSFDTEESRNLVYSHLRSSLAETGGPLF
jgi:hypothetical protein